MATESRQSVRARHNGHGSDPRYDQGLYNEAVLGFKNYWYPVLRSKQVRRKPVSLTVMKELIVLMRTTSGEVRALTDECAHRGTQLSAGEGCLLKGTDTITCPYHGWTYDLNDGMCVAVLPEGPESEVPGKIRIRTYPVEERKGIIWIWMGKGDPVPVEDDIPDLIVRDDTIVKFRPLIQYGNWRWHSENVVAGHAAMIHKNSVRMWFHRPPPMRMPRPPRVFEAVDGLGVDVGVIPSRQKSTQDENRRQTGKQPPMHTDFPGLGRFQAQPLWRRVLLWPWLRRFHPSPFDDVQGADSMMMMMPGIFRVPNHPSASNMYYEWYVPVDENHYIYAQVTCIWGSNPVQRWWRRFWFHIWGNWTGVIQFNNQDLKFTRQTTNFTERHGTTIYPLAKVSRNDDFHTVWRQFASEFARGEGYAFKDGYKPEDSPLVGMVAELPWLKNGAEDAEEPATVEEAQSVPSGGSE